MEKLKRYLQTTQRDIQEDINHQVSLISIVYGSLFLVTKIVTPDNNDDRSNEELAMLVE
jgi:hypothetical protein